MDYSQPPINFKDNVNALFNLYALLLWYGLALVTRRNYFLAVNSWELYCVLKKVSPYLAKLRELGEWIACRTFGTSQL